MPRSRANVGTHVMSHRVRELVIRLCTKQNHAHRWPPTSEVHLDRRITRHLVFALITTLIVTLMPHVDFHDHALLAEEPATAETLLRHVALEHAGENASGPHAHETGLSGSVSLIPCDGIPMVVVPARAQCPPAPTPLNVSRLPSHLDRPPHRLS